MSDTDRETKRKQANTDALDELKRALNQRRSSYTRVIATIVLQDEKQPVLRVYSARFQFDNGEVGNDREVSYDYGDLVLARRVMSVDAAIETIAALMEEGRLVTAGLREAETQPRLSSPHFLHSGAVSSLSEWPLLLFSANIPREQPADGQLLLNYELPYFPTREEAISNLVGSDMRFGLGSIIISLPDYRGRIGRLHVDSQSVTVEVISGTVSEEKLRLKVFAKGEDKNAASDNLSVRNGSVTYGLSFESDQVTVLLLSDETRDKVDERYFSLTSPLGNKDVVVDDFEASLTQLIERGESASLELKRTLDTSEEGEYLETIVAFANTKGGTLIVGVDDNCRVVGWRGDAKEKLTNRVSELCDPPVTIEVRDDVSLDGKPVTVVRVSEGTDKPYILKGRGIFVRRGSSDRQITRRELDKLYEEKPRQRMILPFVQDPIDKILFGRSPYG